uniref:Uncharacterized protein n=1 Tax=Davidia involucrata TaxID=16924 RepID=A0A5B6ZPU5_DAVIN
MAQSVLRSSFVSNSSSIDLPRTSATTSTIFGSQLKLPEIEQQTHLRLLNSFKTTLALRLKASREPLGVTQELTNKKQKSVAGTQNGCDMFNEMKHRFLSFKKHKYLYGANNSGLMLFTFTKQLFSPFSPKKRKKTYSPH